MGLSQWAHICPQVADWPENGGSFAIIPALQILKTGFKAAINTVKSSHIRQTSLDEWGTCWMTWSTKLCSVASTREIHESPLSLHLVNHTALLTMKLSASKVQYVNCYWGHSCTWLLKKGIFLSSCSVWFPDVCNYEPKKKAVVVSLDRLLLSPWPFFLLFFLRLPPSLLFPLLPPVPWSSRWTSSRW